MLDEDIPNWPTDDIPYSGSMSGTSFDATYAQTPAGVCAFRGGTLSGSFSDDGLTFEALETLAWGPSERQVTVQRRWTGRRSQGQLAVELRRGLSDAREALVGVAESIQRHAHAIH